MDVLESVFSLWETIYPERAYQAGITSAAAVFFVPTYEHLKEIRRRGDELEAALANKFQMKTYEQPAGP